MFCDENVICKTWYVIRPKLILQEKRRSMFGARKRTKLAAKNEEVKIY